MTSADSLRQVLLRSSNSVRKASQGKNTIFPVIYPPHLHREFRIAWGFSFFGNLTHSHMPDAVPVRRTNGLPRASFRFHLTMDTLAFDYAIPAIRGSPDKLGGRRFDSIENLYLCAMNNQGLLALAQLILPSEILTNFEVVRVEEEASLIRIYLDESVKVEYKENPEIESKGFCEAVTIRDFPIRDKGVDLIVRRRKWYDKQNNRYFSDSYELKAEGTRYSKEFAAFLKGVYGDDSYDLPFA